MARAGDEALCLDAIARVERRGGLPPGLLRAIALTESGHRAHGNAPYTPWPWTVNNGGDGRYFASKADAIGWVAQLLAQDRRNIDAGCMQVNLLHHPDAFADLEEALDPLTNVTYGARFLMALKEETGSWERAVERYHNAEPALGEAYRAKVYASWEEQRTGRAPRTFLASAEDGERRLTPLGALPQLYPLRAGDGPALAALRPLARRNGAPVVLGPRRAVPGAIALAPGRSRPPVMAPAPGRIAVMTGSVAMVTSGRGQAPTRRVRTAALGDSPAVKLD